MPAVRNQGSRGTCAAHAAAAIKEWQEHTDSGYDGKMSPEFVYFYRENKPNAGMFSRDVMKILAGRGCCTESEFPYQKSESTVPVAVPADIEASAKNNTIKEYATVATIEGVKTALYQNGPCYIAFSVYDVRPQFWRKSAPDVQMKGGHAVVIVGYTSEGFILRNSWGTSFGEGGYVIYPYSDFGMHREIWSTIDSRGSPKPPPEPEPEPSPGCDCSKCVLQ
jgi:C1A family cysteine protease